MGFFTSLASGFEAGWNSSFGVPQQWAFRMARVLGDDEVDFWDEEGFGDLAAVPLLGWFDGDRHDVGPDEVFDQTLGRMGIENNFATNLLANIAFDPITLASGGATVLSRAGMSAGKAMRVRGVKDALSAKGLAIPDVLNGSGNVKMLRGLIDDAAQAGGAGFRDRRALTNAQKWMDRAGEGLDGNISIKDMLDGATKTEIRLSVPFLPHKALWKSEDYSGWMNFLGSRRLGHTTVARATGGAVKSIPFVGPALANVGRGAHLFKESLGLGFKSHSKIVGAAIKGTAADTAVLGRLSSRRSWQDMRGKDVEGFGTTMEALIEGGISPKRAFLKTLKAKGDYALAKKTAVSRTTKDVDAQFDGRWRDMTGVERGAAGPLPKLTPESAQDAVKGFMGDYEKGKSIFLDPVRTLQSKRTEAGFRVDAIRRSNRKNPIQAWAFEAGLTFRKGLATMFRTDAKVPELVDANDLLTQLSAASTEELFALSQDSAQLLREAADEVGMDVATIERIERNILEGGSFEEELSAMRRVYTMAPNSPKSRQAIDSFVARAARSLEQLTMVTRNGKPNQHIESLHKGLAEFLGREIHAGDIYTGIFDTLAKTEKVTYRTNVRKSITGIGPNKHLALFGPKKLAGRFLGELETADITRLVARIEKPSRIKLNDDTGLGAHLASQDSNMGVLMDKYALTGDELLKTLKRVKGRGMKVLTRGKRNRTAAAEPRLNLTAAQVHEFEQAARSLDEVTPFLVDEGRITKEQLFERNQAKKVLEARSNKGEVRQKLEREASYTLPRGPRGTKDMGVIVPEGSGEAVELLAKLSFLRDEMARSAKGQTVWGPAQVDDLIGTLGVFSRHLEDVVGKSMGPKYKAYHGLNRQFQARILAGAEQAGIMRAGAPVGYLGRILSSEQRQVVNRVLGSDDLGKVADTHMPQLSATFRRNADAMTIDELNSMYKMLLEHGGPNGKAHAKRLNDVADELGIEFKTFSDSPLELLVSRLAQTERMSTSVEYIDAVGDALSKSETGLLGKIIGTVSRVGDKTYYGKTLSVGAGKKGQKLKPDQLVANVEDMGHEPSGFIMQLRDGTERIVTQDLLNSGIVGQRLGKLGGTEGGEASAMAFANTVARGGFDSGSLDMQAFGRRPMDDAMYRDLMGEHVLVGNEATVSGVFNAVAKQWQSTPDWVGTFDSVNYGIKKWQTVLRPNFHMVNVGGLFFQMAAVGTSPTNTIGGYWDAMRFLTGKNQKAVQAYDGYRPFFSGGNDGPTGWFNKSRKGKSFLPATGELTRVIRRAGLDPERLRDPKFLDELGLTGEDMVFKVGAQEFEVGEILVAMAEGGLFSTFVKEGLRGSSRVSEIIARARLSAMDPKALSSRYAKRLAQVDNAAESSEVFARMAGVMAQLRQGSPLSMAVRNTKLATVDYAKATSFEKTWLKRPFLYYMFPRHYLPQAWKHFSQDPSTMARNAHFIKSNWIDEDESGRVSLNMGSLGKLNIERLNPNLEALQMVHMAQKLVTDDFAVGTIGESVRQRESITNPRGREGSPFQVSGSWDLVASVFDGNNKTRFADEALDTFWPTRFAVDMIFGTGKDPLAESSPTQALLEAAFLPIKGDRPLARKRLIKSGFSKAQSSIVRRIQTSQDPQFQKDMADRLRLLSEYYADELAE